MVKGGVGEVVMKELFWDKLKVNLTFGVGFGGFCDGREDLSKGWGCECQYGHWNDDEEDAEFRCDEACDEGSCQGSVKSWVRYDPTVRT